VDHRIGPPKSATERIDIIQIGVPSFAVQIR
jgi:hypothetical protein